MAPVTHEHDYVESKNNPNCQIHILDPAHTHTEQLRDVIQDLYQMMVQANTYNTAGVPTQSVLADQINRLQQSISALQTTVLSPSSNLPTIPPELLQYVDNGRNPDIYTREFVELARKGNQVVKGKMEAFGDFRDVLAREMARAMPEVRADIEMVVEMTGGDPKAVKD